MPMFSTTSLPAAACFGELGLCPAARAVFAIVNLRRSAPSKRAALWVREENGGTARDNPRKSACHRPNALKGPIMMRVGAVGRSRPMAMQRLASRRHLAPCKALRQSGLQNLCFILEGLSKHAAPAFAQPSGCLLWGKQQEAGDGIQEQRRQEGVWSELQASYRNVSATQ